MTQAVRAMQAGGPEVLEFGEVPTPKPGPGEVLVDVEAAGVNFIDTYRRSGVYPMEYPHVVGSRARVASPRWARASSPGRSVTVSPGMRHRGRMRRRSS
jgi:hypothetical protein